MNRIIALSIFACIPLLMGGCGNAEQAASTQSKASSAAYSASSTPKYTEEQKQNAKQRIQEILDSQNQQYDEVKKITLYFPWDNYSIPAKTGIYWIASNEKGDLHLLTKVIQFSTNTEWVFWNKLNFSTDEGNWVYRIKGNFPEQNSGGKSTTIVMGGKYESLGLQFSELKKGYQLLVNGTNPIIRFEGNNSYYDYHLTSDDIAYLKQGIELDDLMKIVGGKI